jgi:hypothetical protein
VLTRSSSTDKTTYNLHYQPRFGLAGKLVSRTGYSRVRPIAGLGIQSRFIFYRDQFTDACTSEYSDVQAARDAVPYGLMLDQGHRALSFLTIDNRH